MESPKHGVRLGFTNQVSMQSILEYLPEAWSKPVRDIICKFPEKRNYLRPQDRFGQLKGYGEKNRHRRISLVKPNCLEV